MIGSGLSPFFQMHAQYFVHREHMKSFGTKDTPHCLVASNVSLVG